MVRQRRKVWFLEPLKRLFWEYIILKKNKHNKIKHNSSLLDILQKKMALYINSIYVENFIYVALIWGQ